MEFFQNSLQTFPKQHPLKPLHSILSLGNDIKGLEGI